MVVITHESIAHIVIFFVPYYKRSTMEEFGISLKTIHDKLCERDIPHRDPCDTFLLVDEYMVYQIEIDDMFSKMGNAQEMPHLLKK